jgi:hypothetical protein
MPTIRKAIMLLIPLALLAGCGGDAAKPKTMDQAGGGAPAVAPVTKKADKRKEDTEFKANPAWDRIAPHFVVFVGALDKELHTRSMEWKARDAFKNNYEVFFPPEPPQPTQGVEPKPQAPEEKKGLVMGFFEAMKKAGEKPMELELAARQASENPLVKRPLKDYRFQIIMSGVANPEALVVDSTGITHMLHVNDRIGSEGGFVQDILKTEVLVKLPEAEAPEVISLAPPEMPAQLRSAQ